MFLVRWLRVCVGSALFGVRLARDHRRLTRQERLVRLGEHLADCLVVLGPIYVKMGQVMSTRPDLLPEAITSCLARLQDDVPPMGPAEVRAVLERAYGRPVSELFSRFDPQPVASASIAQVHDATLPSGERVAVKIVRQGVRRRMAENFAVMSPASWALDRWVPACRRVRLRRRFVELRALLLPQCDMRLEAAHQVAIGENFEGHPHVLIPRVHQALVREDVLVMEFVEGLAGKEARQADIPHALLARRAQDAIYTMLYFHGLCHADPHPGNLILARDGRIAFVDFGIVARLSEEERLALSAFFYACIRQEWEVAIDRFTRTFVESDTRDLVGLPDYRKELGAVLRYHFADRTSRWSTLAWFRDALDVLLRHGALYSTAFTRIELVFISGEGFITQVDPDIDIWENARRFNDRASPYVSEDVRASFQTFHRDTSGGSVALAARASQVLIAQSHLDRCVLPSSFPLFVERAEGCRLTCVDGRSYIDLSCGYGPHFLGYAHPVIVEALAAASRRGCINALGNPAEVRFAELLVEAFPGADLAILSNSGTEAVIQALRLCRAVRGRGAIAKFEGHYHGFSDDGLMSSWFRFAGDRDAPDPTAGSAGCNSASLDGSLILQYGQASSLTRLAEAADRIAAVIVEPFPAATGDLDLAFLRGLREVCTRSGIPLIFDEVVTGFRVAYGGIQTRHDVTPDLTCLGKIIGGSLPCGAVVGRREIMGIARTSRDPFLDLETRPFVSGTMSGNSLACAAGTAVLTHLRDHPEIYERLDRQTRWLISEMRASAQRHQVALRVSGSCSIFSFAFDHRKPRLFRDKYTGASFKANLSLAYYMRRKGIYVPELHTMMLSASHTDADVAEVAAAFDESLGEMVADGFFVT